VDSLINNAPPDRDGRKDEVRFDLPEIENKTVECLQNS